MRTYKKSDKLENVCYDIRGPVLDEAKRLEEDGYMVTGRGAETDTLVASARAYVYALTRLMVKRQKTARVQQAI